MGQALEAHPARQLINLDASAELAASDADGSDADGSDADDTVGADEDEEVENELTLARQRQKESQIALAEMDRDAKPIADLVAFNKMLQEHSGRDPVDEASWFEFKEWLFDDDTAMSSALDSYAELIAWDEFCAEKREAP